MIMLSAIAIGNIHPTVHLVGSAMEIAIIPPGTAQAGAMIVYFRFIILEIPNRKEKTYMTAPK